MESNQQYALYDGEAGGPQRWVAHVRLTPELLTRLQQQPASVTIQLQAPGGGGATRASNTKLNSVLTIDSGDTDGGDSESATEKYEMLSFKEDSKVNSVCAFRPDQSHAEPALRDGDDDAVGYSLYQVGRVYQKLIVQRLLDSTEKDRMKDRHAKSVLESKSRSSKLVAADEARGLTGRSTRATRGKMLSTKGVALAHPPGQDPSRLVKQGATIETVTPIQKRTLRSALTEAAVLELQERIARGRGSTGNATDEDETNTEAKTPLRTQTKSSIFSSDSEADCSPERSRRALELSEQADSKQSVPKDVPAKKSARKATPKGASRAPGLNEVTTTTTSPAADSETTAQGKASLPHETATAEAKTVESSDDLKTSASSVSVALSLTPAKRKATDQDPENMVTVVPALMKLPPVKASKTEAKKRARPRTSRLPDISFLPPNIQDICKRISAHITRTAILDATDYESFAAEHERLRVEWEELDRAYSIESILIDGAHFQLPFATTEEEKQALRSTIQGAEQKREGLLFVRDTMTTIHKILASLQTSISVYEQKTATT